MYCLTLHRLLSVLGGGTEEDRPRKKHGILLYLKRDFCNREGPVFYYVIVRLKTRHVQKFLLKKLLLVGIGQRLLTLNTLVPIRSLKLSNVEPSYYLDGRPSGEENWVLLAYYHAV